MEIVHPIVQENPAAQMAVEVFAEFVLRLIIVIILDGVCVFLIAQVNTVVVLMDVTALVKQASVIMEHVLPVLANVHLIVAAIFVGPMMGVAANVKQETVQAVNIAFRDNVLP